MNEHTGEIKEFKSMFEARKAGSNIKLTDLQAQQLSEKTPYERIEWAAKKKSHFKARPKAKGR